MKIRINNSLFSGIVTLFHLVYTLVFPSILNGERFIWLGNKILEPSYIHSFFISRVKFGEFARRPMTTWLIQSLEYVGIPLELAFVIVIYGALFFTFYAFLKLAQELTGSQFAARVSTILFATTFWVIHAVFAEIYAYDEPLQYAFLFASFIALNRKQWFVFSLWFLLALMVRESSLLLLPGIVLFFLIDPNKLFSKENIMRVVRVIWTIPAYGLFLWLVIYFKQLEEKSSSYMEDVRFKHLYYSFSDVDIGIDTIISFLMALFVPFLLITIYRKHFSLGNAKPWIWATLVNLFFNTVITFTLTMGRETRIFAQPMLMAMPFLGFFLLEIAKILKNRQSAADLSAWIKSISMLLFFAAICFALALMAYEIYWPTDTKFFHGFQHHVYFTLSIGLAFFLLSEISKSIERLISNKKMIPGFAIIILLFSGIQQGYRGYDTYAPIAHIYQEYERENSREALLVVGTATPNIAETYFNAKDIDAIAGNYNLQLPLKQFFYRDEISREKNLIYIEQIEALNFPFLYILSQYGSIDFELIDENKTYFINTSETRQIESFTFHLYERDKGFEAFETTKESKPFILDEEYSLAFRTTLSELNIDTLTSIAAKADFKTKMSSEGAIVITIKNSNEEVWEHEYLNVYLIETNDWNTAYKAFPIDQITDPMTEIGFYIWNPSMDAIELKNLEIVINSKFVGKNRWSKY